MADYSEGKIYLIKFKNDPLLVYVGSTKSPLNERLSKHKSGKGISLYKYIHENCDGNWNDWYIELYEDYPCLNKEELDRREGEITFKFKNDSNYNCINKYIAGRTHKEYRQQNYEQISEKKKEYRKENKEKIKEYHKEYRKENTEKISEKKKEYYEQNKQQILEKAKEYQKENKQQILEKKKEKITCECGCIINKSSKARHLKTKKHDIQIHKTITNNT